MSIFICNKTISTFRKVSGTYSTTETIKNLAVLITPATPDVIANFVDIPATHTYQLTVDDQQDILEGDKIVNINDTTEFYIVRGVMKFDNLFMENTQVVLERKWTS